MPPGFNLIGISVKQKYFDDFMGFIKRNKLPISSVCKFGISLAMDKFKNKSSEEIKKILAKV